MRLLFGVMAMLFCAPLQGQDCGVALFFVTPEGNPWPTAIRVFYLYGPSQPGKDREKQMIEPTSVEKGLFRLIVPPERSRDFLFVDFDRFESGAKRAGTSNFALPGCGQSATVALEERYSGADGGALGVRGRLTGWKFDPRRRYSVRVVPLFSVRSRSRVAFGEGSVGTDGTFRIGALLGGTRSAIVLLEDGKAVGVAMAVLTAVSSNDLGELRLDLLDQGKRH